MTLVSALVISIVFVISCLYFQIYRRKLSKIRFQGLELRPNCLLTKYPIAFLEGSRSPFRFLNYWNDITLYLREHGYDILTIAAPANGDRGQAICSAMRAALQAHGGKIHVVADSSQENELRAVANANLTEVASLTLIRNLNRNYGVRSNAAISPTDLKPTQTAIQVFTVASPETRQVSDWLNRFSQLMLFLHNRLFSSRAPVDPLETAEWIDRNGWQFESRFLDLAISLAERDAQWSD